MARGNVKPTRNTPGASSPVRAAFRCNRISTRRIETGPTSPVFFLIVAGAKPLDRALPDFDVYCGWEGHEFHSCRYASRFFSSRAASVAARNLPQLKQPVTPRSIPSKQFSVLSCRWLKKTIGLLLGWRDSFRPGAAVVIPHAVFPFQKFGDSLRFNANFYAAQACQ